MSEALSNNNSHDKSNSDGTRNDPLEFVFDPQHAGVPSLRPPKLSEAGLQAAIQFGFSETYLPSSVTGADRSGPSSASERSNNSSRQQPSSLGSMNSGSGYPNSNNYNQLNGPQNQSSPLFVDNYNQGLTAEQLEGLLAPLRRPNTNQVPAGKDFCFCDEEGKVTS